MPKSIVNLEAGIGTGINRALFHDDVGYVITVLYNWWDKNMGDTFSVLIQRLSSV